MTHGNKLNHGKENIMSKSSEESSKTEMIIEFTPEEISAKDNLQDSDYINQYLKSIQPTQRFVYD